MKALHPIFRTTFTFLVLGIFIFIAMPVQAAGIMVNSSADNTTSGDNLCTLREAINNANTDSDTTSGDCAAGSIEDTISFAGNYTITLTSQLPFITTSITINGTGAQNTIIQAGEELGDGEYRIFEIDTGGVLTLNGLTVKHGYCYTSSCNNDVDAGGGVYNAGYLTVTDSIFYKNIGGTLAGTGGGGAIYNNNGNVTIVNTQFVDNQASYGGGIYVNDGLVTVSDSSFTRETVGLNSARGGGAIYNVSSGAVSIQDSTFSKQLTATFEGGAIFNNAAMDITNSTFVENRTNAGYGAAAYNGASGVMNVTNSTFAYNSTAYASGGAGISNSGSINVYNSIIANSTNGGDCNGTINADSYNMDTDGTCGNATQKTPAELNLHPTLIDYGGATETIALLTGSHAINAGNDTVCQAAVGTPNFGAGGYDQRGVPRPQSTHCDVGAYEYDGPPNLDLGPFNGGAEITSDQPIVAIGRPHLGTEIASYNGATTGATLSYLPMLFNNKWGYTSTFTVQNTGTGTATYDLTFKDAADGSTSCTITGESLPQHGVKTYDVTNLGQCDSGNLPDDWFGGATIDSDEPLAVIAKPDVNGTDAVTYSAFTGGAQTAYLPMLFRGKWGYQSAFYVQNLDATNPAYLTIDFYDADGNFTCTYEDLDPIVFGATRGYWMGGIDNINCTGGDGFDLVNGWAGSAVIETTGSTSIVAIGRPHLGAEVAAYNGFTTGSTTNYLPMLFRGQWGYDAAIYIQNVSGSPSDIEIDFYDTEGNYTCTYTDPAQLQPNATRGYWTPALACTSGGSFPANGWAGSAKVTSSQNVIAVGRPHLSDGQVVVYNAFTGGATDVFVPYLFRNYGGNESALYIQNLSETDPANTTITYYDEDSGFYCSMEKEVQPGASGAIWLAGLDNTVCLP